MRWTILTIIVAALLALAQPVLAAQGDVQVKTLESIGEGSQEGMLTALASWSGADEVPAQVMLMVRADRAVAYQYNMTYDEAQTPLGRLPLDAAKNFDNRPDKVYDVQQATISIVGAEDRFGVAMHGEAGAISLVSLNMTKGLTASTPRLYLEDGTLQGQGTVEDDQYFPFAMANRRWDEPHLLSSSCQQLSCGQNIEAQLEGDMVLELQGADATLEGEGASVLLDATEDRQDNGMTHRVDERFVRIELEGARVHFARTGDVGRTTWAGVDLTHHSMGLVRLEGATGVLERNGHQVALDDDRVVLDGGHGLIMQPTGDTAEVTVLPWTAPSMAMPEVQNAPSYAVVSVVVAAVVLCLASLVAWRMRPATMLAVERSLENGDYPRAARRAARILRRHPLQEAALLGRAIALTRDGRAGKAVAELEPILAARTPSDGALHYVLGAAYMDLGDEVHAKAAFGEAGRRTPGLAERSRLDNAYS